MSMTVHVEMGALEDLVEDMAADVEAAIRPAAQAAAQILVDEVQRNVDRIGRKTGNLARSIYQVYSKSNSGKERAVYHVSWNARKAPHGHLVEFGHMQRYQVVIDKRTGEWITLRSRPISPKQVGARPFVRPARSKFPQALDAATEMLLSRIKGLR
jgi:hypothetical protein